MKTTNKSNKDRHPISKRLISSLFVLLLLVIALLAYRDSLKEIFEGITRVSPSSLFICTLLSTLFYLLEGMIVYRMAVLSMPAYRFASAVATVYRCEFYRLITFGSGTGIAEIHYLHKSGIESAAAAGLSILQFVMKKIGIALLGILGFLLLYFSPAARELCRSYLVFLAAGCIITAAIILFLLSLILSDSIMNFVLVLTDKLADRFPSLREKTTSAKEQITLLNRSGHILFSRKGVSVQVILFNLLKFAAIYVIPAYLLSGQCSLSAACCTAMMAVVYLLAGVIPTPSGMGSLEFVYLLFFGSFADPSATVPSLLVFRFVTWILPFLAGGVICLADKLRSYRGDLSE